MTKPTDEELLQWLDHLLRQYENKHDDELIPQEVTRRDILSAIRERLLATQWRPIKDAPRDEEILLAGKNQNQVIDKWEIKLGKWLYDRFPFVGGSGQPTHFMPLQQPPEDL
jgi:hypothetical protein